MSETHFSRLTEHVYWMSPGKPDRPSLAAVVGTERTLMLDAGASAAHARLFLDALKNAGVRAPDQIALTHWHWDHVFGAAAIGAPVIAHARTRDQLKVLAGYDWSDAALDARVKAGEEIAFCADNIKIELPAPRSVEIVMPTFGLSKYGTFDPFRLGLGGVSCEIQYVGGDHAHDSCVMYIEPDRVLFLGDCLYPAIYTPNWYYTSKRTLALIDTLTSFDAQLYIEGHNSTVMNRQEFDTRIEQMRLAADPNLDEVEMLRAFEAMGYAIDDDVRELVREFINGRNHSA